jgi:hypothetical protein
MIPPLVVPPYLDYVGNGAIVPGGQFRLGVETASATHGFTANQAFCCMQWTDPLHQFVLLKLKVYACVSTAFTTAQLVDVALWFNRAWTVGPSAGTAIIPFGVTPTGRVRDIGGSMQNTLIGALQFSMAGTPVTPGTRVQDSRPIAYGMFNVIALGSAAETTLYDAAYANECPVVCGVNEGLEITIPTLQGAVGHVMYVVNMAWAEVNNF